MELETKAAKFKEVKWNTQHTSFRASCPGSNGVVHELACSASKDFCFGNPRCDPKLIAAFFANGAAKTTETAPLTSQQLTTRPSELDQWKTHLWITMQRIQREDPQFFRDEPARIVVSLGESIDKVPYLQPPADLSRTDAEEEIDKLVALFIESEVPKNAPAVQLGSLPDVITIDWEDHASALIANEEYLTHVPIIEGLCYAKTASLLVGGKHSGKTTNARTIALSVCRGLPVFGRQTTQGPVLYCASEDEVLVVRSELLRMGWDASDALGLMKIGSKTLADPERLLDAISDYATRRRAVLIILDMLFDFAGIKDEMSYAGTREAAGKVYDLAMRSDAHVIATHHSPKYMSGGATAETAALGSQGIAARFSPIILSRHWGGDLYTIESTPPRDPRGKGLDAVCITLDDNGMSRTGEKFADSMRWRVMAPKVLDFISSVDPGQHHTVSALSEGMEINRPMMQTILFNLCREGKLHREKKGRSYKYFLPNEQGAMWQGGNE